jgi:hypothetical protein
MGFLDHSTNNIIVDAVLTDLGRQALSRNDGSFSIYQFALGDDEVDYDIISQYGRTVGKEKIEKNTPVLEALTQGSLALKYPLISASNEFLTHLSVLTVTATTPIALNRTQTTTGNLVFEVGPKGDNTSIEFDLIDSEFLVEMNNIFLTIQSESPDIIYTDNIATYRFPAGVANAAGTYTTTIPLVLKSFSNTTFNTYSTSTSGSTIIRTYVKIIGVNSGLTKTIEVQIS